MVTVVTSARTALALWACCFSAQALSPQADSWDWHSTKCKPFCANRTATAHPYLHLYKESMLQPCNKMQCCQLVEQWVADYYGSVCMQLMDIIPCLLCQYPHLQHQKDTVDSQRLTQSVCEFFQSGRSDPTNCCSWGK